MNIDDRENNTSQQIFLLTNVFFSTLKHLTKKINLQLIYRHQSIIGFSQYLLNDITNRNHCFNITIESIRIINKCYSFLVKILSVIYRKKNQKSLENKLYKDFIIFHLCCDKE